MNFYVARLQAILFYDDFPGPQPASFRTLSSLLLIIYKFIGLLILGNSLIVLISFYNNMFWFFIFFLLWLYHAASGSCRRLAMKVVVTNISFLPLLLALHLLLMWKFPNTWGPLGPVFYQQSKSFLIFMFLRLGLNNLLMAYEDKSAYALCAFSFALGPDIEPITFLGKTLVW